VNRVEKGYKALDYYSIDDLLTEDERMIRDLVRNWVDTEVMPIIGKYADDGRFPVHLIPQMAELGLFGPTLPEKYGGSGASEIAYGLMMQELERGDSGVRSFASVQSALVMYPIFRYGSEEQRKKYLPKLAKAELIGCFGLTEPDHGSDPGSMKTRAEKDGDGYRLNGAKMWITNGTISDIAVVWAKLDGVVRGFIVEKGMPGFTAPETKMKWSLRASVTSELVFQDVKLPASAILPDAFGLPGPLSCLTQARYGIAWGAIGAAMACFDEARRYALQRVQFSKPIASFQLIQHKLTEMATEITKGQLLNLRLAQLKQAGKMTHQMVSMAKRNGCYQGLVISRMARDILGAAGITYEFQSGRHMVNLESVYTYEGTHDIHTLAVGADLTGIEAFR
jgi:glutaryl-CoA dehydrogenase